ncbi:MAG: amino acid adenylation domain-containing protein [Steroidobacteraceae bacterium]
MDPGVVGRLWSDVLGLSAVPDASRSFFSLGGDSLRAAQLCTQLSAQFNVDLTVRDLFQAPTLRQLCDRLALLPRVVERAESAGPVTDETQALSYSQERMFVLHELAAGSAAYHVPMAWRLQGTLDVRVLRSAFDAVVAAHEVLGLTVISDSGQLYPLHGRTLRPRLSERSLTPRDGGDALDALDEFLTEYSNRPFQLEQGPLLRATLVHLGREDAVLVAVMHHMVCDQWGLDVFFRDIARAYAAMLGHKPTTASTRPSFSRYAAAHRRWFEQHRRTTETEYWHERLRGLEPTVLNEDFVRPQQQGFRGARLRLDFNPREILALRQFGAARGASLAMVLVTALKILLFRHTGRNDIAVGLPVANRQHPKSANLMGTLVNTLVLRTELDGNADFTATLARVRESMLGALEHQDLPFEVLVRELNLERDPGRPPLFTVMFNMLNTPLGDVEWPGLKWSRRDIDRKASQFDLTVTIDADYARSINFEYSTALFSPETIRRLADHYMALLRSALQDASLQISTIGLISATERELLNDWAQGARHARTSATIDALFDAQVARSGGATALCFGDRTLSYTELAREANAVADSLLRLGIGAGDLVGLHLQRTPQMLTALLGVLKAGAAYVPLDPSYPTERLVYMASDARLRLLLTDAPPDISLQWPTECSCLRLDELARAAVSIAPPAPPVGPRPADPAYVIYTSGSTGRPKGVVVPHGTVTNFLLSMQEEPGLGPDDRLLAITTLSFDIAVLELLLPLTVGARVVLTSRAEQADGEALQALLLRHGVTVMQATPSTWRLLIDSGWNGNGRLRALVGGEPLSRELANQLLRRCAQVWNMYGPTETTVWSSCGQVEPPGPDRISLGRPIANTTILVLDEDQEICPVGVAGEIFIGGDGVSQGYLERPELTAERFVANPHSSDRRGTRLYRTGDRGRWRQDGRLEHLGRLDTQIKLRGFRIELGEIESRLMSHPDIAAAVVLTVSRAGAEVALVAWIVPRAEMPDARAVREFLRQWLPEFMLPQHLIAIPELPLLPNGKLDRQALPPPRAATLGREPPLPPRSAMERTLWEIWREMLQHAAFGVHDNLFEIGGHSLLAVRLAGRIRSVTQRNCNLALLFRNPTIAALAAALSQTETLPGATIVPLQTAGVGPELFCLCGIMIYRQLAEELGPDVPVCGVFVPREMVFLAEGMSAEGLGTDIPELAREYLEAIRSRQPRGPYRLVGFSFGGALAYEVGQQLRAQGETVSFLAVLDCDAPGLEPAGQLRHLWHRIRRALGKAEPVGDPLGALRDARYLDAIRRYQPRPWAGEALCVFSADTPPTHAEKGWQPYVPAARMLRIDDSHLGLLKGEGVKKLAAFLRRTLMRNAGVSVPAQEPPAEAPARSASASTYSR